MIVVQQLLGYKKTFCKADDEEGKEFCIPASDQCRVSAVFG